MLEFGLWQTKENSFINLLRGLSISEKGRKFSFFINLTSWLNLPTRVAKSFSRTAVLTTHTLEWLIWKRWCGVMTFRLKKIRFSAATAVTKQNSSLKRFYWSREACGAPSDPHLRFCNRWQITVRRGAFLSMSILCSWSEDRVSVHFRTSLILIIWDCEGPWNRV